MAKFAEGGVASPAEAAALLTAGGYTPLDVRTAAEHHASRSLPRAHNAPLILTRDAASGAQQRNGAFLAHVAARFPEKDARLLVHCSDGRARSRGALQALEDAGYSRLAGLRGGYNAFAREFMGADAAAAAVQDDVAWVEWAPAEAAEVKKAVAAPAAVTQQQHVAAPPAAPAAVVDHAAAAAAAWRGAARDAWVGAWAGAAWAGAAAAADASASAATHAAAAAHWRDATRGAATLAWMAAAWSGAEASATSAAHAAAHDAARMRWSDARHSSACLAWSAASWAGAQLHAATADVASADVAAASPEQGERGDGYVIYRF